jgi:subfamily B ATP-binding cassette protein MsbA
MKSFRRIFCYVWPQWPRVIVVVLSAIIVSSLLSLSFMTVIPLLKVMMGEEGLHGWVERGLSKHLYGVSFYVPEKKDFAVSDIESYLLVTDIKDESPAQKAGLQKLDKIIGASDLLVQQDKDKIPSSKLLEKLATAPANAELAIQIRRDNKEGVTETKTLTLDVGPKPFYTDHLEKLISFLPREQTKENKTRAVIFIILGVGTLTIIRCLAKFYQEYLAQKVVQIGINHMREDAFDHAIDMPIGFFPNERPSDTISRIVRDTSVMGKAIKIMLGKALREPLNVVCILAVAIWINWQLTLIFLCGAPFVILLVAGFGKKMKRATRKSLMAGSEMLGRLQETMAGLKIVKIYNRRRYERENFKAINKKLLKQLLKISKVDAATMPVMEVLGMAAGSVALVIGAQWVTAGEMEGSGFFTLLIALGFAAESARKTSDIWNKMQEANAAAERVFTVIDEPPEFEKPDAIELPTLKEKIEFRNVVFSYPSSDTPALKGINLTVQAGHNVAIVGPNGSGKTTLANLIPRFYNPDSGRILIDDIDIYDVTLRSLRNQIGMVTQNVVTFNDTIAANIAYGKPDATREEIIAAAKRAFAHEFIEPLPDGYETIIGEHGAGLSGGQLQRIVIARAILKNPTILIFDEATSQVDADSEAKIHRAIEEIMQDRTSFIIAHRFSTVISADVIVVMDNGKIIAQGLHEELIQTCSLYQSLYKTQMVSSAKDFIL